MKSKREEAATSGANQSTPQDWSSYAFDNFEVTALRPRWFIQNTDVNLSDGKVFLTNRDNVEGLIALKGLYKGDVPRIFLYWPWAMETHVICPTENGGAPSCSTAG